MNRAQLHADIAYAAMYPESGPDAMNTMAEVLLEHDQEIADLKAQIQEIIRNGTGAGVTG